MEPVHHNPPPLSQPPRSSDTAAKVFWTIAIGLVALVLLLGAFAAGLLAGYGIMGRRVTGPVPEAKATISLPTPKASETPASPLDEEPPQTLEELFQPFWEAWDLVHEYYVDQPVDDVELMRGAIRGMMDAVGDPYTTYMDPQEVEDFEAIMSGEYEGIGAWVDVSGDYLTIIAPIPGSPAERAGLRPGDKIIAVDGEDVTGVDPEQVRLRVLGPAGTKVRLTILREPKDGGQPETFDVVITRARIKITSVESTMMDNGIAYVRLITFGERSADEMEKAIEDLMAQHPRAFILDLRNNGGGYLDTAIEVASFFLPEDAVVLYEKYGDGSMDTWKTVRSPLVPDLPMVVLVNEGTASASEVVSGALRDHDRAVLVGEHTFGKGSVQRLFPLSDGGMARITVAYWLTPEKHLIHGEGLEPDYVVPLDEGEFEWLNYQPDPAKDPQVAKAVEVLLGK